MTSDKKRATVLALLSAAFYALNAPFSKLLLSAVAPTMMAALLYIGAGVGMGAVGLLRGEKPAPLTGKRRYAAGMVLLGQHRTTPTRAGGKWRNDLKAWGMSWKRGRGQSRSSRQAGPVSQNQICQGKHKIQFGSLFL